MPWLEWAEDPATGAASSPPEGSFLSTESNRPNPVDHETLASWRFKGFIRFKADSQRRISSSSSSAASESPSAMAMAS